MQRQQQFKSTSLLQFGILFIHITKIWLHPFLHGIKWWSFCCIVPSFLIVRFSLRINSLLIGGRDLVLATMCCWLTCPSLLSYEIFVTPPKKAPEQPHPRRWGIQHLDTTAYVKWAFLQATWAPQNKVLVAADVTYTLQTSETSQSNQKCCQKKANACMDSKQSKCIFALVAL